MKYSEYDMRRAARFVAACAQEEKSGQMEKIAQMLDWAADMMYLTPHPMHAGFEDRLVYEYVQLEERVRRIGHMLDHWDELAKAPDCPREVLAEQHAAMMDYKALLEKRAKRIGIKLPFGLLHLPLEGAMGK